MIGSAISAALNEKVSLPAGIVAAVLFFALFVALPVWTIPGNTLAFQLKIFRPYDYALMGILAILVGLTVSLETYSWRRRRGADDGARLAVQGTLSGGLGMFASVVGTATCGSCLAVLFGLVGLGAASTFFVLQNQQVFLLAAIGVMLIALVVAARRADAVCRSC